MLIAIDGGIQYTVQAIVKEAFSTPCTQIDQCPKDLINTFIMNKPTDIAEPDIPNSDCVPPMLSIDIQINRIGEHQQAIKSIEKTMASRTTASVQPCSHLKIRSAKGSSQKLLRQLFAMNPIDHALITRASVFVEINRDQRERFCSRLAASSRNKQLVQIR